MRLHRADKERKGWFEGPWNSDLPISIGYANEGIDEPHFHKSVTEIYLVAQGTCEIRVGVHTVQLRAHDLIIIDPREEHTFLSSSPDYFHFVVHAPGLQGEAAQNDKVVVSERGHP